MLLSLLIRIAYGVLAFTAIEWIVPDDFLVSRRFASLYALSLCLLLTERSVIPVFTLIGASAAGYAVVLAVWVSLGGTHHRFTALSVILCSFGSVIGLYVATFWVGEYQRLVSRREASGDDRDGRDKLSELNRFAFYTAFMLLSTFLLLFFLVPFGT